MSNLSLKQHNKFSFPFLFIVAFIFISGCSFFQKKEEIIIQAPEQIESVPGKASADMVLISAKKMRFYIDKYEAYLPLAEEAFSAPNQFPQVEIAQIEAEQYCQNAQKRLCSAVEWETACLGLMQREYFTEASGAYQCNINNLQNSTATTASFSECKNDYGLYDMLGNAAELTSTITPDGFAVVKGGAYSDPRDTSCFTNWYLKREHKNEKTGFRCCKNAY